MTPLPEKQADTGSSGPQTPGFGKTAPANGDATRAPDAPDDGVPFGNLKENGVNHWSVKDRQAKGQAVGVEAG